MFFDADGSCKFNVGVALAADEARRRRCDPVVTRVAAGEARLWTRARFRKEGSRLAACDVVVEAIPDDCNATRLADGVERVCGAGLSAICPDAGAKWAANEPRGEGGRWPLRLKGRS